MAVSAFFVCRKHPLGCMSPIMFSKFKLSGAFLLCRTDEEYRNVQEDSSALKLFC